MEDPITSVHINRPISTEKTDSYSNTIYLDSRIYYPIQTKLAVMNGYNAMCYPVIYCKINKIGVYYSLN